MYKPAHKRNLARLFSKTLCATAVFALPGCEPEEPVGKADPAESGDSGGLTHRSADDPIDKDSKNDANVSPELLAYRHPLLKVIDKGGPLPMVEAKNSLSGRRYAVMDSIQAGEGGTSRSDSQVVELEVRRMTAEERANPDKKPRPRPKLKNSPLDKLGPKLRALSGQAKPGADLIDVSIALHRPVAPTLQVELGTALATGEIQSKADYMRARDDLQARRRATVRKDLERATELVHALGGKVLQHGQNIHFIRALLPAASVHKLAEDPEVMHIEAQSRDVLEVDGEDIIKGHQAEQFIDNGYDGENTGSSWDITFAQIEGGGADNEHPGFLDWAGSGTRIRGMFSCDSSSCSSTSNFGSSVETNHASGVAGIIFGDIRDGQDAGVTGGAARRARSGIAGEARGWLFEYDGNPIGAFDHVAGMTGGTRPVVANISAGNTSSDTDCGGDDSRSIAANEMFESGVLLFKSAGNQGHSSTTNCTVTSPGSAAGVFTVGAIGDADDEDGDEDDVRTDDIRTSSSRGGIDTAGGEGGRRTIIDMAAFGCRELMFNSSGGYTYETCGTSFAAPTMTGTAINFIDAYKHAHSDLIDDPGILFANLLLMGDRESSTSSIRKTTRFDNLFGAGRLRARQFDTYGLDGPYGWATGRTCVDDGEVVTLAVNNGNTISSDVEALKAAVWWYPPSHESNGVVDDIDLRLETTSGSFLRASTDSYDNKEFLFYDVGNRAVRLEISGFDVTSDNVGCGSNSMMVYWAWFFEDSDRDDINGPDASVWAEDNPGSAP